MSSVRDHYEALLARHYTAMAGGFEPAVAREAARLDALLPGFTPDRALDLGAGSGFQTVALARRGVAVTALDLSATLLAELREAAAGLPVRTIEGDMLDAPSLLRDERAFDLIVCMGDTLTHLPSRADVARLCTAMAALLAPGGRVVLTFRDLTAAREGVERFLPVKLSDDLIMTCFLEYETETVAVHDLVHAREEDGWHFAASSYRKLRLDADAVAAFLVDAGLAITHAATEQGLVTLVASAEA
jgi:SAM-dependent methyltransferase